MKTINAFSARVLFIIALLGSIFLYSCKNTRQGVKEDYQNTREDVEDALTKSDEEITAEKEDLYAKMQGKKEEINTHIDQLQEDARSAGDKIDNVIGQLELEKEKLNLQLSKIESAPNETWGQTKDDMEGLLKEVTETVDNLIAGLQN